MTAVNLNRAVRGPVTAVPIVAGKGVRLVADTENNRWVVEADETVLFTKDPNSSVTGSFSVVLSEAPTNFEYIEIMFETRGQFVEGGLQGNLGVGSTKLLTSVMGAGTLISMVMLGGRNTTTFTQYTITCEISSLNTSTWSCVSSLNGSTTNNAWLAITRVLGINRIANN